ncbi:SDR family NAD(P)-dependent oxidoreductase [Amycolatopsis nigrescens]|uniref:SDR family NAD(P)-dependent oxidoreductase n=1 Tax=Amycolatopsis nigrescens TaxID=381445 RepID=UPI00036BA782|nr:SDR family NAD(P)-dependent oxidoreductase [Amycolatopsis nigrescens]
MAIRRVLVTGAAGGLGAAVASLLAQRGHPVVLGGRDKDALGALAERIGPPATPVPLDVADEESVRSAPGLSEIDILVNCAGVLTSGRTEPSTLDLELAEQELRTNALGAWRVAQAVLPGMVARGWGRIVNVSSGTASFRHGLFAGASGYTVSKVALNAITVLLAGETRDSGVLVNAVNPGRIKTKMMPMAERSPEQAAPAVCWAATLPDDGPTGRFFAAPDAELDW